MSTHGATDTGRSQVLSVSPPIIPASSVTAARSSAVVAGPAASRAMVAARAASSQASPSGAMPAPAIALAMRLRSEVATRAEALPHAAGSRSRGKTKRVRRIASCFTTLRSS